MSLYGKQNATCPRGHDYGALAQLWNTEVSSIQNAACDGVSEFSKDFFDLLGDAALLAVVIVTQKLRNVFNDNDLRVQGGGHFEKPQNEVVSGVVVQFVVAPKTDDLGAAALFA